MQYTGAVWKNECTYGVLRTGLYFPKHTRQAQKQQMGTALSSKQNLQNTSEDLGSFRSFWLVGVLRIGVVFGSGSSLAGGGLGGDGLGEDGSSGFFGSS
jgi:hypothetical protein